MTVEDADEGNTNQFQLQPRERCPEYYNNCQSCVVAFEARLRGYHVCAAPYDRKDKRKYKAATDISSPWLIDNKTHPKVIDILKGNEEDAVDYLDKTVKPGERYVFAFSWRKAHGRHVVSLIRDADGTLCIVDSQVKHPDKEHANYYKGLENIGEYFRKISLYNPGVSPKAPFMVRVDNAGFNIKIVKALLQKEGGKP